MLADHRLARRAFAGFPPDLQPADEDEGYAVQELLHQRLLQAGRGPLVGHKIGCTTHTMQSYLGISSPCAGGVFGDTVHHLEAVLPHGDYVRVGVECELAVRLGSDLPAALAPFDVQDVRAAIAALIPAIEIVEDRYHDFPSLSTPTLIADDFFGAGCVLGRETHDWQDLHLPSVSARMLIDGGEVGRGTGADILGDPLNALLWLANSRARRSQPLVAGEIVLLGSLVQTHWIEWGQTVLVENVPLGSVEVRFG
jgi:2-keto-4-pentenoate hydratase